MDIIDSNDPGFSSNEQSYSNYSWIIFSLGKKRFFDQFRPLPKGWASLQKGTGSCRSLYHLIMIGYGFIWIEYVDLRPNILPSLKDGVSTTEPWTVFTVIFRIKVFIGNTVDTLEGAVRECFVLAQDFRDRSWTSFQSVHGFCAPPGFAWADNRPQSWMILMNWGSAI